MLATSIPSLDQRRSFLVHLYIVYWRKPSLVRAYFYGWQNNYLTREPVAIYGAETLVRSWLSLCCGLTVIRLLSSTIIAV